MKVAEIPADDASRISALTACNILDTPEEKDYDDITYLAADICQTPIALVSLIDSERQWFKSHHGLDARETPRDISFCGHAIHHSEIFEVEDATVDPRFSDNPLTTGFPKVIFYAGFPLTTASGHRLGTLCVIDNKPNKLTDRQRNTLGILAKQVVTHLELRRKNHTLEKTLAMVQSQKQTIQDREDALLQQTKMATLGQLSAGIAHEINNPLTILSLLNRQIRDTAQSPKVDPLCAEIATTTERMSAIVSNLLAISKHENNCELKPYNLSQLVEQCLSIANKTLSSTNITVNNNVDQDLTIRCLPVSLSQLLLNLLSNSADAIKNVDKKWIRIDVERHEDALALSVTDSGGNLPVDLDKQLFEPFFSTKNSAGTGLGLCIASSIAQQHGGEILLAQRYPNTKFTLSLPIELIE